MSPILEKMFKAVIFDMDGTVSDSIAAEYMAWKKLFEDHGASLNYKHFVSFTGIKSAEIIVSQLGLQGRKLEKALESKSAHFCEYIETEGVSAIPGVENFLQKIKDIPLKTALASGARRPKAEILMKKLGLSPYFDILVTAEDVALGKPDPSVFLLTAERLDIPPWECLVFEDSESGVLAAKKAGMTCVALDTTTPVSRLRNADLIISTYENYDLNRILSELDKKAVALK